MRTKLICLWMGLAVAAVAQSVPNPGAGAKAPGDPGAQAVPAPASPAAGSPDPNAGAPGGKNEPEQTGAGDLMVTPPRVVLDGRQRSAEVMLRNSGKGPCTYRVSWKEMRMRPDGKLEEAPKAEGAVTAADLVRCTPKQVTLGPGESQLVRLMARLPEGLKEGEYHSHLVFQTLPPALPPTPAGQDAAKQGLSFGIQTLLAFSIPVFVRCGTTSGKVGLSHLALKPAEAPGQAPALELQLDRQGNQCVRGELTVDWQPASGRSRPVMSGFGAVIYPEIDACADRVVLDKAKDLKLAGGRLKVTFAYKDNPQPPEVAFLDVP